MKTERNGNGSSWEGEKKLNESEKIAFIAEDAR
jgi:hypothetical protein